MDRAKGCGAQGSSASAGAGAGAGAGASAGAGGGGTSFSTRAVSSGAPDSATSSDCDTQQVGSSPSWTASQQRYMREALREAQGAYDDGEVAVGCVIVHTGTGEVIGRGRNRTNVAQDGTRHCEFLAMEQVVKSHGEAVMPTCELYVTVEPCIMCAYALAEMRIGKVVFGCGNDKFGGNGSVLSLHTHAHIGAPHHTYESRGGLFASEAVALLRQFYERGNVRAPKPQRAVPVATQPQ